MSAIDNTKTGGQKDGWIEGRMDGRGWTIGDDAAKQTKKTYRVVYKKN